jgi:hypothetical protein
LPDREALADRARAVAARPGAPVEPDSASVRAIRDKGGFLDRLAKELEKIGT